MALAWDDDEWRVAAEAAADNLAAELEAQAKVFAWRCDRTECDGKPHEGFDYLHARSKQVLRGFLPEDDDTGRYRTAYLRGGRGSGKSKASSWNLAELIVRFPGNDWACVGPTFGDARDTCMEGSKSGLILALGGKVAGEGRLLDKGPYISAWNRSMGQLLLKHGGTVFCDGADDGAYRIQGKNLSGVWCTEVGLWKKWRVAWDESIKYAVRETPAKVIADGTPKRTLGARQLVKRLMADDSVLNVQLYTEENLHNLDPAAAAEFMSAAGTSLERQELYGDLLEEVEGALWKIATFEDTRVDKPEGTPEDPFSVRAIYDLIQPTRVCVAVDPAASFTEDSDEHGILVEAKGQDGDIYLLEDASFKGPVTAWPMKVIEVHERWQADRVIGEVNHGADYIGATLRAAGFKGSFEEVRATRGKLIRAEPVATYHEREHVHVVGYMPELESQCCTWVPGEGEDSPDRLDAMVYGAAWLSPALIQGWGSVYKPFTDEEKEAQKTSSRAGWAQVYAKPAEKKEPEPAAVPAEPVKPKGGYFG